MEIGQTFYWHCFESIHAEDSQLTQCFFLGNQSTSKVQCRFVRKRNATDADAQRAVTDRTVMDANGGFGASESIFYYVETLAAT